MGSLTFFLEPLPDLKSSQDCCFFCVCLSISWKRCLLLKLFCSFFLRALVFSSSVSLICTHCREYTHHTSVFCCFEHESSVRSPTSQNLGWRLVCVHAMLPPVLDMMRSSQKTVISVLPFSVITVCLLLEVLN